MKNFRLLKPKGKKLINLVAYYTEYYNEYYTEYYTDYYTQYYASTHWPKYVWYFSACVLDEV